MQWLGIILVAWAVGSLLIGLCLVFSLWLGPHLQIRKGT
jgi:hypothetical protein